MSETTTLLKVGSAELVLRLIEAGVPMRDFTLENPIRAIRDMSRDRSGQVKVALSNGRRVSALELQNEYYEKVSDSSDGRAWALGSSTGCSISGSGRCEPSLRTNSRSSTPRSTGQSS